MLQGRESSIEQSGLMLGRRLRKTMGGERPEREEERLEKNWL